MIPKRAVIWIIVPASIAWMILHVYEHLTDKQEQKSVEQLKVFVAG